MDAVEKRSVTLPAEQAAFVDKLVERGAYATSSEVIQDGLRALQEREAEIERWLLDEVAPTYDRMKAERATRLTSEQMMQSLRERHQAHLKARG